MSIDTTSMAARFWAKVDRRGNDDCWPWIGLIRSGYGAIAIDPKVKSKRILAHRLSWMLQHGPIAEVHEVLHTCRNRGCVNPAHLQCLPRADAGKVKTAHLRKPAKPKDARHEVIRLSQEQRFWRRFRKSDGCWEWTGQITKRGYGWLPRDCKVDSEKGYSAHRYSYALHYGPIPDGLLVMHLCDNRKCVRPDHLQLGTPSDNVQDMISKGRARWQQESQSETG